jgi:hypothetical protein
MYLLFLWRVRNGFEACNIITRGIGRGWALKIETFLGPEMARAKRVPFGPKKVESDFLTSYGSGSGSTSQKVTVPTVPVPQRCLLWIMRLSSCAQVFLLGALQSLSELACLSHRGPRSQ